MKRRRHVALLIETSMPTAVLPGDLNADGIVDAADYTVWRDGLGTTFTQADYDMRRQDFGAVVGLGGTIDLSSQAAVPRAAIAAAYSRCDGAADRPA